MQKPILLLGDPLLYTKSEPVRRNQMDDARRIVKDLSDTLQHAHGQEGAGGPHVITAPQIGVFKRIIYIGGDAPLVLLNPHLTFPEKVRFEVMDDCLSIPQMYIRVSRFRRCVVRYMDVEWSPQLIWCDERMSALMQHASDHLDGILSMMRAIDGKSFFAKGDGLFAAIE